MYRLRLARWTSHLGGGGGSSSPWLCPSRCRSGSAVTIGDVTVPIATNSDPCLVPECVHSPAFDSQEHLSHLRWLFQKHALKQDVFLLGPPGPERRRLALHFAELLQLETEYMAITRDTTESDLKQRREIVNGSVVYVDQPPVTAAMHGRLLIIEGIEKAERNVLPTLNNLLENREMALDDGRFLVSPARYDSLLSGPAGAVEGAGDALVRVHPSFRVIAIGLPVPRWRGFPLDPPLRSRFQARNIAPLSLDAQLEALSRAFPALPATALRALAGFRETLKLVDRDAPKFASKMPFLGDGALEAAARVLATFPGAVSLDEELVARVFPFRLLCDATQQETIVEAMQRFDIPPKAAGRGGDAYSVRRVNPEQVQIAFGNDEETLALAPAGPVAAAQGGQQQQQPFEVTPLHRRLFVPLAQDHAAGRDLCIVGPRGSGKSALALRLFAREFGYKVHLVHLFRDQTSRDLLQRRVTDAKGNTVWQESALVEAARTGGLAVLDGLDRLPASTLAALTRLIEDRDVTLFDGTRLLRRDRWEALRDREGISEDALRARRIFPVHPSFRVLAIALPPTRKTPWLTEETAALFSFHAFEQWPESTTAAVLRALFPHVDDRLLAELLEFAGYVREHAPDQTLSLRQLIRVVRRVDRYPEDLEDAVKRSLLFDFLPTTLRQTIEDMIRDVLPSTAAPRPPEPPIVISTDDGVLDVMGVKHPINQTPARPELVPKIVFYDIADHVRLLRDMLKDFVTGERWISLIGNQGVGKNVLTDRLLELLQLEREYMQLHRDTTVQALTVSPSLKDGVIAYVDSPLVRAAKHGRVAVIDEADKAPVEVVAVLKGLLEDGVMRLGDGQLLEIHPDFRCIVLANRPGFPFLGNDFFGTCGDVFSTHVISNPDEASELALLRAYGPDVDERLIRKLVECFNELRALVENAVFSYPYSTRELVAITKHLQLFPDDGLMRALENVFDFDVYDPTVLAALHDVFHKHGIPIRLSPFAASTTAGGAREPVIALAKPERLAKPRVTGRWTVKPNPTRSFSSSSTATAAPSKAVQGRRWRVERGAERPVADWQMGRFETFTEEKLAFRVPLPSAASRVLSLTTTAADGAVHVLASQPLAVYTFSKATLYRKFTVFALDDFLPVWHINVDKLLLTTLAGKVALYVASHGVLMLLEPGKELDMYTYALPIVEPSANADTEAGKVTNTLSRFISPGYRAPWSGAFGGRPRDERATERIVVDDALAAEHDTLLLYRRGSPVLALLSPQKQQQQHAHHQEPHLRAREVVLPGGVDVEHVVALSPSQLTVYDTEKRIYDLQLDNDADETATLTRVAVVDGLASEQVHARAWPVAGGTRTILTAARSVFRDADGPLFASDVAQDRDADESVVRGVDAGKAGEYETELATVVDGKQLVMPGPERKHLSVVSVKRGEVRHIPLPGEAPEGVVRVRPLSADDAVSLQRDGTVRIWEVDPDRAASELAQWRKLFGKRVERDAKLRLEIKSDRKKKASMPKHGKHDAKNDPHVGGNTWAGGTGGADTAGLGGKGGPYRLDAGHDVHQLSEREKQEVDEAARKAARAIAKRELGKRLKAIDMDEKEHEAYERFLGRIEQEIAQLRLVLENAEAQERERDWLRHQQQGDLDDAKIIDGATGDRQVYRRRGVAPQQLGMPQRLPKRLLIVADVSGSMYRFNGLDGRLDRMLETALLIMEALDSLTHKFDYCMVGHSGDGARIPLVEWGKPPATRKERLKVLMRMHAHSQYCQSGDHTLEAVEQGVEEVASVEADQHLLFLVSDANLRRYGIQPSRLFAALRRNERVDAFAIFLASLQGEAEDILRALPADHGFDCSDSVSSLPHIFQQIFRRTLVT